ncbi:MAG TPA: response regulator transcription factor [Verrucomicrobiae bacterium]|nr:response regulator transcription factor [Verrucomicrobiae bacterium]
MPTKNKVFLVDDHPLVREWLSNLINEEPDLEVCGQAGGGQQALALIGPLLPQVIIVDISLEGGSGLELIKDVKIQHPQARMIVLSMHDEMSYAERAMRAGAAGYIMKREATDKVLDAIRTVLQGGLYFSNAVNAMLAQKLVQGGGDKPVAIEALSDRELEVFQLLGRGLTTRQVSEQMNVGFKTVHAYCARIKEKLNLATINELIFQAVRWHESQQPR